MLGSVALVYAPDQLLADLAREVEVDVRYRCERLVQEAAEEEARGDGIDVRQPHQVADDGRHRRPAPSPGEQATGGAAAAAAQVGRHLAREVEQVVVDEEEAAQPVKLDQPQLFGEPPLR